MRNNERFSILAGLLLWAVILGTFVLGGHWFREHKPHPKPDPKAEFLSKRFAAMLDDQEHTMLAAKYGLQPKTVMQLLADYDNVLWSSEDEIVLPEATNTEEVINSLSTKYGVPSSTVASLLIDREMMRGVQSHTSYSGE